MPSCLFLGIQLRNYPWKKLFAAHSLAWVPSSVLHISEHSAYCCQSLYGWTVITFLCVSLYVDQLLEGRDCVSTLAGTQQVFRKCFQ